jgi:hypothetical protein
MELMAVVWDSQRLCMQVARLDQAQQDAFLSQLHQQYRQEMDAQIGVICKSFELHIFYNQSQMY